jgi:uncharacterized protein
VLQHLLEKLQQLDAIGAIAGLVTVVPYANPLGMSQRLFGPIAGRFDFENGENFNRNFPLLDSHVESRIAAIHEREHAPTPSEWKTWFAEALARSSATSPTQAMKHALAGLALQHDIVLDLHCDTDCIAHIYASELQHERATALAGFMGAPVVMLEPRDAGGGAFDQVHSSAWGAVQAAGLLSPRDSGFSATIELRGQADVNDEFAANDSANLLRFLASERLLTLNGTAASEPSSSETSVFPLDGAAHIQCPCSGIIVYSKAPGDPVSVGERIAEIVRIDGDGLNQRVPVFSTVDGLMIVRQLQKLVRAGQRAALLAGKRSVRDRNAGSLLLDF